MAEMSDERDQLVADLSAYADKTPNQLGLNLDLGGVA